jgi:dihydroorotase
MIDPHVHFRDWKQQHKETIKHGLLVAYQAGLDGVFEMPNTDPALTTRDIIEQRIDLADRAKRELGIPIFHGLYAGITSNPHQIEEVVKAHHDFFPRVVGLKMFAAHSTGEMGIVKEDDQLLVYKTLAGLDYHGVLAVHCEKESLITKLFNPEMPKSHSHNRSPLSEAASVKDQIHFLKMAKFKGKFHICHVSAPRSLDYIDKFHNDIAFFKDYAEISLTCGITPHHAMLHMGHLEGEDAFLLKMNPPLRTKSSQEYMLDALCHGKISWIESDHAPHTRDEKINHPYASGIPVLPYYPHFVRFLKEHSIFARERIEDLTHNNIVHTFGIDIKNTNRLPDYHLEQEYQFDPFHAVRM